MGAHKLTIRPMDDRSGFPSANELVVLLDGKPLDGVTRVEIVPIDAGSNDLVKATITLCVSPDYELPADVMVQAGGTSGKEHFIHGRHDPVRTC